MFTTGCYEPRLQPVALSDRPSVDKPTPAWFGPRQKQGPRRHSYKLDEAGFRTLTIARKINSHPTAIGPLLIG